MVILSRLLADITINATASDSDGTISKVEFFRGTTKLGEDTSAPYSFAWSDVAAGTYNLTAKATDNDGATTTSAIVAITVNVPSDSAPSVSITSPSNGSTFVSHATIVIKANASDPDGAIKKVEFFRGTTKLGEDTTPPYSFTWDNAGVGNYNLKATAVDNSNKSVTTNPVPIVVGMFFDDFDDNNISDWTFTEKGHWQAVGGNLTGIQDGKADIFPKLFGGCDSCTIVADLNMIQGVGTTCLIGWFKDSKSYVELSMNPEKDRWTFK